MQKITPFLWFDDNAIDAMNTYVSLFENAGILHSASLSGDRPGVDASNTLSTVSLAGFEIILFNGGPHHRITPAVSLFVNCESVDQLDRIWNTLVDGGEILMPLDAYPFNEHYGWLQDRFGVSWQLMLTGQPQSITPCLLFVGDQFSGVEEAITLYTSLFQDSSVGELARGEKGEINHGAFTLAEQPFVAMESDLQHDFAFTERTSFMITCTDQAEVDHFWNALIASGGQPGPCGWLKDPFGLSWQVVPTALMQLMSDPDPAKAQRVTQAMLQMSKINIGELEVAHAGVAASR